MSGTNWSTGVPNWPLREMLLSGATTMVDGYFLQHQTARAIQESGMRGIVGQGVLDFPAPGVPDPSRNIETAETFIRENQDPNGLVSTVGVLPFRLHLLERDFDKRERSWLKKQAYGYRFTYRKPGTKWIESCPNKAGGRWNTWTIWVSWTNPPWPCTAFI